MVDLGLKLLLVVGLAYAALALLRRFGPGSTWRVRNGQIRVLESAVLAPNRAVYLVRAADRQLLLGVTPTQITHLAEWDVDQPAANGVAPVPFATLVGPDPGT
jgi:flagellar biosynthetic protein FliO